MGPFIFSIDGNWFAAPNARARETAPETSTRGAFAGLQIMGRAAVRRGHDLGRKKYNAG